MTPEMVTRRILHKVIGALRWALVHLPFKYVLKTCLLYTSPSPRD